MPAPGGVHLDAIEVLTFDCYGTLIDWESGLLAGLRRVLGERGSDEELLEAYARAEARLESGSWQAYRQVLRAALAEVAAAHGVKPTDEQSAAFAESVAEWPAFDDSVAALGRLARNYRLGVITNCDDDLFSASNRRLGQPFSWVVTAEQVRAYKPSRRNFEAALERIGRPPETVLHVAQSLYHDHVPAKQLGLTTAWIDRRHGRHGSGATPAAAAQPDLVATSLADFAAMALGS
jgi:2-haloacid dehalogenase